MNNVTCSIVEDLLPLYMDGCCSKDSQQAVVEHMKTCENAGKRIAICRVICPLSQMKRPICAPRKLRVHFQKESRNAKRRLRCLR